jgi:hypothetical protein
MTVVVHTITVLVAYRVTDTQRTNNLSHSSFDFACLPVAVRTIIKQPNKASLLGLLDFHSGEIKSQRLDIVSQSSCHGVIS